MTTDRMTNLELAERIVSDLEEVVLTRGNRTPHLEDALQSARDFKEDAEGLTSGHAVGCPQRRSA